jgi:hypothetical protein
VVPVRGIVLLTLGFEFELEIFGIACVAEKQHLPAVGNQDARIIGYSHGIFS